jgi:hypothetical protein
MAAIIEVQESKVEHLSEYAEKVMKYGKKMMECLEELNEGKFGNRARGGRYGMRERYDEEYPRYY